MLITCCLLAADGVLKALCYTVRRGLVRIATALPTDVTIKKSSMAQGKFGENNYKLNILKGFLYLSLDEEEWLEVMAFMLGRGCTAFRGGRRPAPIHKLESRSAALPTHARVVLRNFYRILISIRTSAVGSANTN
jgi:hypothetical protein